jgi:rod shape-determining protein MreC
MAPPRGRRRLLSLSGFLLAAFTLLALGGPLRSAGSGLARAIVSPFVDVVRGITKPVGETFAGAFNYADVVAQNHQLERELALLQLQQSTEGFKQTRLSELLALDRLPFLGALPFAVAQTNYENLSDFTATIEIDKGSSAGVLAGMPVVGAGGLVGIVTATTSGGATVTLLTDASQSIGVTFGSKGYQAVVHGQGAGKSLDEDFVAPGTPVHNGETMYTSGLQGGLFPAGIPVGTVVGTQIHHGATEVSISVKPLANLSELDYVDVVLWEPGS